MVIPVYIDVFPYEDLEVLCPAAWNTPFDVVANIELFTRAFRPAFVVVYKARLKAG